MIGESEISVLEWREVLEKLSLHAATSFGKRRCENVRPLTEVEARIQLKRISEIKSLFIEDESPDFGGIREIESAIKRGAKGSTLTLEELFDTRETLNGYERVKRFFSSHKETNPECLSLSETILSISILSNRLNTSITDNGELNTGAYPQIGRLQNAINDTRVEIEGKLSKLLHSSEMDNILQEKIHSIRNDRYVILIKSGMKGRIKGNVQDISSSGATLYFEPENIAPLNRKLQMERFELEREILRIVAELSALAGSYVNEISHNQNIIAELDMITAGARFSVAVNGNEPLIADEPVIELYSARHPLLHLMQPGRVVANDVSLGRKYSALLISGANTGGKTVLLKTVGLSALLAAHGFHIAASPDSRIGIFSRIMADIGDDQNLKESLSTFSGQLVMLNKMLDKADEKTLILIDEIISGTNPRYGAALARAILEKLAGKNAKIIATTHYPELKELASADSRFMNASVSFDLETLKPTYRLNTGIPGVSYTLEIAKIYKIDDEIISEARKLLSSSELSTEALIEKVQRFEKEIYEEKLQVEELKVELTEEKKRYLEIKAKLKEEIQRAKEGRGIEFLEEIQKYREQIAEKIKNLQGISMKDAGELQNEVISIQKNVSEKLTELKDEKFSSKYREFDINAKAGEEVFVKPLEKEGVIDSLDTEKKIATVRLGIIKSRYKFEELLSPITKSVKKKKAPEVRIHAAEPNIDSEIPVTFQTRYNTVDLRGMRVDEAISKTDTELDRMMRGGLDTAVIIHGHGTGALKEAIRTHLKFSFYAKKFRGGEQSEGADGVTIVLLQK